MILSCNLSSMLTASQFVNVLVHYIHQSTCNVPEICISMRSMFDLLPLTLHIN